MKNPFYMRGLRLWLEGLLLLSLRWGQLRSGFDPETGLSHYSLPGRILLIAILFLAGVELFLCVSDLPGGKHSYLNCMEPPDKSCLPFLAAGSLLLFAGGVLLPGWGMLEIAAAALGAASALGLIFFARALRSGAAPQVLPLLPVIVFSVVFVLVIYLPEANNPVLARYYLLVLAAALVSCALYQLAGLTHREGSMRWFVFFGDLAVPLCLAAMADCAGNLGRMLIFFGCALVLTTFLLTRRDALLPKPEPEKAPADAGTEPEEEAQP